MKHPVDMPYAWYMPEVYIRYTLQMLDIGLRYAWDRPEASLNYDLDIPEFCLRFSWYSIEICWNMAGIYVIYQSYILILDSLKPEVYLTLTCHIPYIILKYTWELSDIFMNLPDICLKYDTKHSWEDSELWLRFTWYMPGICQIYT